MKRVFYSLHNSTVGIWNLLVRNRKQNSHSFAIFFFWTNREKIVIILVAASWITPKCSDLKQFFWVSNLVIVNQVLCFMVSQTMKSSLKIWLKNCSSCSLLTCLLKGFSFSRLLGWKSFSSSLSVGLSVMTAYFIKACRPKWQQKESAIKIEATVFYNLVMEVISYDFCYICIFHLLEISHNVQPTLKGKSMNINGYTKENIPGGRDHWEPC